MPLMYDRGIIKIENPIRGNSYPLAWENFQNLGLWKPRVGEAFTICSTDNKFFRARLTMLGSAEAEMLIFEELNSPVESGLEIALLQAIPEKERMEFIIQKATELGVCSIIPFKSKRSISVEERDAKQKKSHKWAEIVLKAAKQSRRATIPQVYPPCDFNDAIRMVSDYELKLLLWENEKGAGLKQVIRDAVNTKKIVVIVGPEGGFDETETEEAKKAGFIIVGLGQRILRTETAAIIAVGFLQYEIGNLG